MGKSKIDLVTVLGHTAAGKTEFAAHLARQIGGEVIGADSRQVYRGMNIGTGKDYLEYLVDGVQVPMHLIDILDAGYEYNVYLFKKDFHRVFTDITDRDLLPVMCGGSGMYLESVLRNFQLHQVPFNKGLREDLEKKDFQELKGILRLYGPLHNVSDTVNRRRTIRAIEIAMYQTSRQEDSTIEDRDLRPLVFGVNYDRITRRERITIRLEERLKNGLVEEIESLLQQGISAEKMEYYGLEYRFVTKYVLKELTYDEMFDKLNTAIHQFAKRQMTYFRGMERRGIKIHWLDGSLPFEEKLGKALSIYNIAVA